MVKISSQVSFFCRLIAFNMILIRLEWLESVLKCYLLHLKPKLNVLKRTGILNIAIQIL